MESPSIRHFAFWAARVGVMSRCVFVGSSSAC